MRIIHPEVLMISVRNQEYVHSCPQIHPWISLISGAKLNLLLFPDDKSSSNTENREVTFLWRSEEVLQGVYLRLNRVTDKRDVKKDL